MLEIVQAGIGDIDELTRMFEAYRAFYRQPAAPAEAKAFLLERLRTDESVVFLALTADSKAVGFTQLYPTYSSTRLARLWQLNDLYVDPAARNQSVARMLMDRAKRLARETQAVGLQLETEKTNDIGNHLYPAAGFTLDTEHNLYSWANDTLD